MYVCPATPSVAASARITNLLESNSVRYRTYNKMGFSNYVTIDSNITGNYDTIYAVAERRKQFPGVNDEPTTPVTYSKKETRPGGLKRAWLRLIGRESLGG